MKKPIAYPSNANNKKKNQRISISFAFGTVIDARLSSLNAVTLRQASVLLRPERGRREGARGGASYGQSDPPLLFGSCLLSIFSLEMKIRFLARKLIAGRQRISQEDFL